MNGIEQRSAILQQEILELSDRMKSLNEEIKFVKGERDRKVKELVHIWDSKK